MSIQIELADNQCIHCKEPSKETVNVKNKDEKFQGSLCMRHLRPLLKAWEPKAEPVTQ